MESLSTNLDLFVILKTGNTTSKHEALFEAVVTRLGYHLSDEDSVTLKEFCRRFTRAAEKRWQKSHRKSVNFRKDYENWLEANVDWPSCVQTSFLPQEQREETPREDFTSPEPSSSSIGMTKRPRKPFEDLGNRQKKRRSEEHKDVDANELAHSAAALLKEDGREDIASAIEHMLKTPGAAAKFNEMTKKPVHVEFIDVSNLETDSELESEESDIEHL